VLAGRHAAVCECSTGLCVPFLSLFVLTYLYRRTGEHNHLLMAFFFTHPRGTHSICFFPQKRPRLLNHAPWRPPRNDSASPYRWACICKVLVLLSMRVFARVKSTGRALVVSEFFLLGSVFCLSDPGGLTLNCSGKDALGFGLGSVVKGLIRGYMPVAFFFYLYSPFLRIWG
jgi:hypothetical protein